MPDDSNDPAGPRKPRPDRRIPRGRGPAGGDFPVVGIGASSGGLEACTKLLDAVGETGAIGKTAGKDAAAGKATLVALLGLDRAATEARMLSEQAAAHLAPFGQAAQRLRDLAGYVVARGH